MLSVCAASRRRALLLDALEDEDVRIDAHREIWLLHQLEERLEILAVHDGRVATRSAIDDLTPVRSSVLPEFTMTVEAILSE
jgi:hypothetical protein